MDSQKIYSEVGERYSAAARGTNTGFGDTIAKAFGYSEEELAAIPKDSNMGLSCGNPLAIATLRAGETVVDLGSGAGLDVFLAAGKVGPTGKVIGVDMNEDMLAKARKLAAASGKDNVEFISSRITEIDLPSSSADCIISNCVINLVPAEEKQLVFNEMHRLLKPGGRVAVSDILAKKPLPKEIRQDIGLYVGCVAGASQVAEYEEHLEAAGFQDVLIAGTGSDLNVYAENCADGCCGAAAATQAAGCCSSQENVLADVGRLDLNPWVGSYKVYAVKR
ncbi:Arsenite methyltransferase [Purpureocillium takamizusanense]|uniref:Arsenite methyltransferase n=1 Tax=Purpureocillium takamizusanense TaxID=2060973 RepID=A0A9Q8QA58_9HYPO|nr:Arsenite methyltransferase [Purpureocillium takamizusanense]UNI16358.1 Arsenite methyltransferase [Purpureocillium takamizusanense]